MTGTDRDTVLDRSAAEMMNRLLDPQEIADMIVLLASPRSAGTTAPTSSSTRGWSRRCNARPAASLTV